MFHSNVGESFMRNPSLSMQMDTKEGLNMALAHRPGVLASSEKGSSAKEHGSGTVTWADMKTTGPAIPRQLSGNQINMRNYGKPAPTQRYYIPGKEAIPNDLYGHVGQVARPLGSERMSGLDGAMDDLAEVDLSTRIDDSGRMAAGQQLTEAAVPPKANEEGAHCLRTATGRNKQKRTSSPGKQAPKERSESSPVNAPGSPKKSGEHSPAKAKIEHVTNKFRRMKKDDVRGLSPEEKTKRAQKWHKRFQRLKESEAKEVEEARNAAYGQ
ncbi:unnamed protein product [Periconia digitata]|uniref:Uncharacterized protein n=1 Tax=Periconia digitata TaxID=1303443 RepID=A0A9W4U0Q5_9PLEO|nr:unnamed protein product [Periconia digitata]